MSYDGMVTHCVVSELTQKLIDGKIDKIYQPENDEIILSVRTRSGNLRLLLSASASNPRVHLTNTVKENPLTPPMLCMLMRKHLQGNRIISVKQLGFDRIIRIDTEGRNELGDICIKTIITEIMGRHSNIILVDENNKIMDSAKHVDFTVSAVRQILPGLIYENPPAQDKLQPNSFLLPDFMKSLDDSPEDALLDKLLLSSFMGMSPLLAREIVYRFAQNTQVRRSNVDTAAFAAHTNSFLKSLCRGEYEPTLIISKADKKPAAFSCVRLSQYEEYEISESYDSISLVIDLYYQKRAQREHMNQRTAVLTKIVQNNIDRCAKKMDLHQNNLKKSKNRDKYKIYGDLLTANMYLLKHGMTEFEAVNYYSENQDTVKIPLQAEKSPSQNAQRYYKLYNKAKVTEKYAAEQYQNAKDELFYLESVLDSLQKAETPAELTEIKDELSDSGYIPKIKTKQKNNKKSEPLKFTSSDGFEILVGRNNKQNDELTIRRAYSTDIWLHTKNIPGSHTIIRTNGGKEVPDRTITEAAQLAAYYSKAQNSSKVPVDYTAVKNVKKPNGAKPGMVIYDYYNTIYVEPSENKL